MLNSPSRYSITSNTVTVSANSAAFELFSSQVSLLVISISIFNPTGVSCTFGLGRPVVIGQSQTSPITGLAEDGNGPAGSGKVATAWGTAPTIPINFFRRINLPAVGGSGIIWSFPKGLIIPVQNSIVLWNIAANGPTSFYCVWDER
jgi:hypothetical protein